MYPDERETALQFSIHTFVEGLINLLGVLTIYDFLKSTGHFMRIISSSTKAGEL